MNLTEVLLSAILAALGFALVQGQYVYRRAARVDQALVGYDGEGGVLADIREVRGSKDELTKAVTALNTAVSELQSWRAALERDGVLNRRVKKTGERR